MGSLMANTDPVSIRNRAKEIKVYPRKTDMPVFLVLLLRSTHAAATPSTSENNIGKTSVVVLTFVMFMSFCRNIGIGDWRFRVPRNVPSIYETASS